MLRGLYTSGLGMTTQMKRLDVISNNIANADTTGFKRDVVITQSFTEELLKRLDDPSENSIAHATNVGRITSGVFVDDIFVDFKQGGVKATGGTLDLALDGRGFIAVQVTDGQGAVTEKYTRDGALTLRPDGTLATKEGNIVLGQDGPIVVPNGEVFVYEDGIIRVNGEVVAQIRVVDFENLQSLRKVGDNLYETTGESVETPFTGKVLQGFLESSNINAVREMVDMIAVLRAYELNQRMVTTHDATMGRIASDIARR